MAETPKLRSAASHRKMLNANLVVLFKETDDILVSQMGKLAAAFKAETPTNLTAFKLTTRVKLGDVNHFDIELVN